MKQLSLSVAVLLTCLVGASFRAHAQADESWYQAALKHNALTNKQQVVQPATHPVVPKRSNLPGTSSRNIVNACDVMVNGGFETQLAVPSHVNNMGGDYSGNNRPDQLSGWYSPTAGSPDYFATNATATSEVQPSNENSPYGSFTPYLATSNNDGPEGAIGLYARQSYYDSNYNTQRDRTSEYAQIDLGQPLPNGQYYADFQVSISHNTSTALATNYGVNSGFGLVFTNTPNLSISSGGLPATTPTTSSRDFLAIPGTAQTVFNQSPITQGAINYGVTGAANWQRVSGQISSTGNLRYVTVGLFNSDPANQVALPNHRTDLLNTYFFVDAIRIFKIPIAGPNVTIACGISVTLGEGCSIPNATYTWSAPGITGLPTSSSTIQLVVNPITTTTYTLTVNLPDGSTSASSVTVNVNTTIAPDAPTAVRSGPAVDDCNHVIYYTITNYNPRFTYVVNRIFNATPFYSRPQTDTFFVKGGGGSSNITYGRFTITATDPCGNSMTSDVIEVEYPCPEITPGYSSASTTVAYPNPATESITIPEGAEGATLISDKGKALRKADASGKLDVQSLPDGLYNLQMMQNGKLINQRIQVKH